MGVVLVISACKPSNWCWLWLHRHRISFPVMVLDSSSALAGFLFKYPPLKDLTCRSLALVPEHYLRENVSAKLLVQKWIVVWEVRQVMSEWSGTMRTKHWKLEKPFFPVQPRMRMQRVEFNFGQWQALRQRPKPTTNPFFGKTSPTTSWGQQLGYVHWVTENRKSPLHLGNILWFSFATLRHEKAVPPWIISFWENIVQWIPFLMFETLNSCRRKLVCAKIMPNVGKNLSWCALLPNFKKNQKRKLVSSQIRLVHFPHLRGQLWGVTTSQIHSLLSIFWHVALHRWGTIAYC